jgi:hypothetical protein
MSRFQLINKTTFIHAITKKQSELQFDLYKLFPIFLIYLEYLNMEYLMMEFEFD